MSLSVITESGIVPMDEDRMQKLLTDEGSGVLGIADDGVPYLLPMSFGYDGDETLYFVYVLFGEESRKETLTDAADRARFVVYGGDDRHEWQSVSLIGSLSRVDDDEWDDLREAMKNAQHADIFSTATPMRGIEGFRFEIEEWSGIRDGEMDG